MSGCRAFLKDLFYKLLHERISPCFFGSTHMHIFFNLNQKKLLSLCGKAMSAKVSCDIDYATLSAVV